MSRDPVDVVREWFDAFNRGDLTALAGLYADDAELDGNEGIARGREAVLAELRQRGIE